jgi:hypothetical protein
MFVSAVWKDPHKHDALSQVFADIACTFRSRDFRSPAIITTHSPTEENHGLSTDRLTSDRLDCLNSSRGPVDRNRSCRRGDYRMCRGRFALRKRRSNRFADRTVNMSRDRLPPNEPTFQRADVFVESVESPGGISPPGAPRTVRDPLESHGSRCSAVAVT